MTFIDNYPLWLDKRTGFNLRGSAGLLVVGRPGTGKTMLTVFLLLQAMKCYGASIYLIDNKRSDLSSLSYSLANGSTRVAVTANETARLLRIVNENMERRYRHHRDRWAYDWVSYHLRPQIILMDEVAATMSEAMNEGAKTKNEIQNHMRSIILRGRQAGVFMWLSSQRLSAEILGRDQTLQLSTRIVMGQADRDTYRMAFPTAEVNELPLIANGPGNGLVLSDEMGSNVPQPFLGPDISQLQVATIVRKLSDEAKNFDYVDEPYWKL